MTVTASRTAAVAFALFLAAAASAQTRTPEPWSQPAENASSEPVQERITSGIEAFVDHLAQGTFEANIRARWENARIDGFEKSNALTLRTRLGYGLKPWHGLSGYVELENVATPDDDIYFDGIGTPNGHTLVADPSITELNQAYAAYALGKLGDRDLSQYRAQVIGGRQRITFDDHRFVGNVGWRQNEQTFDSVLGSTSFGLDGLTATYGYLWRAQRIFGNRGPASGMKDFESNSHLWNLRFDRFDAVQVTAFVYALDFERSPNPTGPVNSSTTVGLRASGSHAFDDDWKLLYAGSFAHQQDAGGNPADYHAPYGAVDVGASFAPLGLVGGGYEVLGSDGGSGQFTTPLATAHKFNGWADVWLDNGGSVGLRDFYLYVAPKLPWDLKARLVYHQYWADDGGRNRGREWNAVLSRKFFRYFTVLSKVAWYQGANRMRTDGGRPDRYRLWLELTFAY